MENVFRRYLNLVVLGVALFAQVLGLAFQVKVTRKNGESARLIRVWAASTVTPVEKALVHSAGWIRGKWIAYVDVRRLRDENARLNDENLRLRVEAVRMAEDASQARRLQTLLKFKEQYISDTVAAQVVGGSGSEFSHILYIDKGSDDGIKPDMAVINATGVVGKVIRVFKTTAQVLEIGDPSSGVGAILEKSRVQGILKGTPQGDAQLNYIMGDEKIEVGERVLTSGGDHIFPKGLPLGTVKSVAGGNEMFLNIRVRPAANLNRVEEVLVVTKISDKEPEDAVAPTMRAAEILAQRLPTVQPKPPQATPATPGAATTQPGATPTTPAGAAKPTGQAATGAKPGTTVTGPATMPGAKPGTNATTGAASANKPAGNATAPAATANTTKKTGNTTANSTAARPKTTGNTTANTTVAPKAAKPAANTTERPQ